MTITSGKGKKKSTTTMKVDYAKEGSDAPKNVELTQSKKEAKAPANSKDSINKAIASVATTLEQLKSKDADDAQASYEPFPPRRMSTYGCSWRRPAESVPR